MTITAADLKAKMLDMQTTLVERRHERLFVDPVAFCRAAYLLFAKHFDEHGWPDEMPLFTLILPAEARDDPLYDDGYAGYSVARIVDGQTIPASVLWKWSRNGDGFTKHDPALKLREWLAERRTRDA